MITIEFSGEDKAALDYERYHHPHPFVQRKLEALRLKSQRLSAQAYLPIDECVFNNVDELHS